VNGQQVLLHSEKAEELVAFLACERGSVSKRKTAAALWPGADEDRAMNNLYKTLGHLRGPEFGDLELIAEQRGSISLNAAGVTSDLEQFLAKYKSDAPEDWESAVELYRGILLIDNAFDWAAEYEAYYDTRYYELLRRLSEHYGKTENANLARYYRARMTE
jgi:two-component SAPR family response regulator